MAFHPSGLRTDLVGKADQDDLVYWYRSTQLGRPLVVAEEKKIRI